MEKNCIFCGTSIYPDVISYKIGEYHVCYRCATTQTIRNLSNAINDELRVGSNVIDVTDFSLSGQTESLNESEDAYRHAVETYTSFHVYDVDGNSIMWDDNMIANAVDNYGSLGENIPAHVKVNGYFRYPGDFPGIAKAPIIPEYFHDATVMSEDDYLSKYVDDYDALKYWTDIHPESIK